MVTMNGQFAVSFLLLDFLLNLGRLGRGWGGPKSSNFSPKIGLLRGSCLAILRGVLAYPSFERQGENWMVKEIKVNRGDVLAPKLRLAQNPSLIIKARF